MADRKFTLFELHLHEPSFSATKLLDDGAESVPVDDEVDAGAADGDDESGGACTAKRVGRVLVALAVVAVVAVAVRRLLGTDEELEALADLDDE